MVLLQSLEEAVIDAETAGPRRERWEAALEKMKEAFLAAAIVIAPYDHQTHLHGGWALHCGYEPAFVESYRGRYARLNPLLKNGSLHREPGQCWRAEDAVAPEAFRQSEFYDEWLKPQGHEHVLRAAIDRQGSAVTYITVSRGHDAGPFGAGELDALGWATRHLRGALQVAQDLEDKSLRLSALLATLDKIAQACILTDGQHVWHGNRKAKRLLEAGDGLRLRRGTLEAAKQHQSEKLGRLIGRICNPAGPQATTVALPRGVDRRPLLLTSVPVRLTAALFNELRRCVVLFIENPEEREQPDPAVLQQWFGLTPAEAKLVALLIGGHRLGEAAITLGICVGTARNHLKSAFAKTGTNRQADLIALVASVPTVPIAGEASAAPTARIRPTRPGVDQSRMRGKK